MVATLYVYSRFLNPCAYEKRQPIQAESPPVFKHVRHVRRRERSLSPHCPCRSGRSDYYWVIGCGACSCSYGRGIGAVSNAFMAGGKNVKILAIADLFPDIVEQTRKMFAQGMSSTVTQSLNNERDIDTTIDPVLCFSGWDAYKKLLAISEINYVILSATPHFRPLYLKAIIEAGKHCFIEKTVAVDVPGCRSIIESGKLAKEKGLGILGDSSRRHAKNYQETIQRVQDGAIGKITSARAFWMQGLNLPPFQRKPEWSDTEYQLRNSYYYTWLSGDIIAENHLHNLDVINWVMGAHPLHAFGTGGRAKRTAPEFGNVYDHFTVEFAYPDGVRMTSMCCEIDGIAGKIGEEVTGTQGASNCMNQIQSDKPYKFSGKFKNPYEQEHADFIASIRAGTPINEAQRLAESTLTAIMGRESAYSGKVIDWDSLMESERSLAPDKYEFGPLPVAPVPQPGIYKFI